MNRAGLSPNDMIWRNFRRGALSVGSRIIGVAVQVPRARQGQHICPTDQTKEHSLAPAKRLTPVDLVEAICG